MFLANVLLVECPVRARLAKKPTVLRGFFVFSGRVFPPTKVFGASHSAENHCVFCYAA